MRHDGPGEANSRETGGLGEAVDLDRALADALADPLAETGQSDLFEQVELPLISILARMESIGIALDSSILEVVGGEIDERVSSLVEAIHEEAGSEFNPDSPKQLQEVLFERLGLPPEKKTKTGYSTDAEVLRELASQHPICGMMLEYRQLVKLKNTYVDTLPKLRHPTTGRIHSSFNQTTTATGRLSSSEPNLQNIPVRTELGRRIRSAFISSSPQRSLLKADYSQVELRMLAHLSRDPGLVASFEQGLDIHASVASQIVDRPIEEVSPDDRRKAKAVNFGIVYGQTPFGLSRELGIGREEASRFIDAYFERYPGVRNYIDRIVEKARESLEVRTWLGRRRPLPGLESRNPAQRAQSERMAINTVVQGSAADLIKKAMLGLDRRRRTGELQADLLLQIHDELVFELDNTDLDDVRRIVVEEMTSALDLSVPLVVDLSFGRSWVSTEEGS